MAFGRGRRARADIWNGIERRQPAQILVVNDDPDGAELLVRLFRHEGFRAGAAHDELETLSQVHQTLPRCVVLDMARGGVGSSLKTLELLRSNADRRIASTRVLVCAESARNRNFAFRSGADAFLVRPFHADDLMVEVAAVLRRPEQERVAFRTSQLS
ncbi:MAG: response regulator transcription factor [Acidimicrobiia bacterium]